MAFSTAADAFIFVAGCILFTVHIVKVVRDARSSAWRKTALETCAKLARLLRSRFSMHNEADELAQDIAARLRHWQVTQFKDALKVLLFFFTVPIMILAFSKVILGVPRLHSAAQDAIMVGGYTVLLLAESCPWLVNERTLDWWYAGIMSMAALFIIPPVCPSTHLLEAVLIVKMCGAVLSLGRMSLPAVVFWNGVHFACDYWAHSEKNSMAMNFSFEWPLMISFLIGKIQAHVVSEIRKDIEAKLMQDRQSAGEALSAMFYDVVVELDCNLRIAAPTPKLAAFLLRSTTLDSLQHTPFEDLLQDEEDQERFRNLLSPVGCTTASSFVELAHARMRGSSGVVFQVELFGYRYRGPGGHQRYLVGIREAGDFERGGVPVNNGGPPPVAASPFEDVAAVINPYAINYPILSSTTGFSLRITPVAEGTCLLPAVVKRPAFEAWIQKAVNWYRAAFESEEEPSDPPAESFEVTFKPRTRNGQMCTRALCRQKVKYSDDSDRANEGPWDGQITVELTFSCIRQLPGRPRAASIGSSSSSSSSKTSKSSRSSGSGGLGTPSSSQHVPLGQPVVLGARTSL